MDSVNLCLGSAAAATAAACLSLAFLLRARSRLRDWERVVDAATGADGDHRQAVEAVLAVLAGRSGLRALYLFAASEGEPVSLGGAAPAPAAEAAARVLKGHAEGQAVLLPGSGELRRLALAWESAALPDPEKVAALALPAVPLFLALSAERAPGECDSMRRFASLGKLAGGVAHELNTPLSTILTSASRLSRTAKDPAARRRLQLIIGAVERCRTVVDKLMLFARRPYDMEDHGLTFSRLVWTPLEVNALVEDTLELHRELFEEARIVVQVELGELPVVTGDPGALSQAMSNLLRNAREALEGSPPPEGKPRVRIHSCVEAGDVVLTVEDNGPGLPAEKNAAVTQPFVTGRPGEASGLGLAIVEEVAERHGGRFEIGSPGGRGTRARLFLPSGST